MSKKTTGVFLARLSPLTNAHMYMIDKMVQECDNALILIGSADKKGTERNPFSIHSRKMMLLETLRDDKYLSPKISVQTLQDFSHENDHDNKLVWGDYLYYNILNMIEKDSQIKIYYSDDPEIMKSWFEEDILENLEFGFVERSEVYDGLSATKIREAIRHGDIEYVEQNCPLAVVQRFKELQTTINNIK